MGDFTFCVPAVPKKVVKLNQSLTQDVIKLDRLDI